MYRLIIITLFLFVASFSFAQSKRINKQKDAAVELSKSLEEGKSDTLLARNYETLAHELIANNEYAKAEENFVKAKNIYVKLKENEEVARIERELAKLKETQNKTAEAIDGYRSASKISKNKKLQDINTSDVQRLQNQSNSAAQVQYIHQKIALLEESSPSKEEKSDAYRQMAQANMELNQPEEAIANYETALKETEKTEDEVKITREMAQAYTSNKQPEKAVELNEQLVTKSKDSENPQLEIEQLQNLSSVYFENGNEKKGVETLMQAYQSAVAHVQTLAAKQSAEMLADYYQKHNRPKEALQIYADFNRKLESLIRADSSLVDAKVFQVNEEKIARLEKERELKDELIQKQDAFNRILLAVIILILVFLFFIVRAWLSIRVKNKKIALQSLRREMNPHFIFNSLNSVNQFIAQNNELEANKYLTSYSKLMRTIMENSNKDFIPLSVELQQMKEYLHLENRRFGDKFTYTIEVAENLDTDAVFIPNMLIQPQLENAVWHGLRYKEEKGHLLLKIFKDENRLSVIIEDNGIGIKKSEELKTPRQKEHKSRGLTNTLERIELLNKLYHTRIRLEIKEKDGEETGVTVTIQIPDLSLPDDK